MKYNIMNKKQLYNSIIKDVTKIIKKHLNEDLNNDLTPYLNKNGEIDLSDLNSLPEFIINNLVNTILNNCEYESNSNKSETTQEIYTITTNTDNDDIYLRSLNSYEIELSFIAEYDIEYIEGYDSYDYDVPSESPYLETHFINLYDITLNDGGNNKIKLSNELCDIVKNEFCNSEFNDNLMTEIADYNDIYDYDPKNNEY